MFRTKRAPLAGVVLAATIAVFSAMNSSALDVQAIGGLNTLTVSPTHGRAGSALQLTYSISPCTAVAGLTIGFSWAALPPVGQVLGTAPTDASCRATLTATPPVSAATHQPPVPGTYQVFGYVALPIGGATPNTEASASYRIDVPPAQTAGTPTPTARSTVASNPSSSASASTEATAAPGSGSAASPATSVTSSSKPTVGGIPLVFHAAKLGPWTLEWQLAVGVAALLLLLTGLALFAIAALRRRRTRATNAEPDDKAA